MDRRQNMTVEEICPACQGSGEGMFEGTRCRNCGGSGAVLIEVPDESESEDESE